MRAPAVTYDPALGPFHVTGFCDGLNRVRSFATFERAAIRAEKMIASGYDLAVVSNAAGYLLVLQASSDSLPAPCSVVGGKRWRHASGIRGKRS